MLGGAGAVDGGDTDTGACVATLEGLESAPSSSSLDELLQPVSIGAAQAPRFSYRSLTSTMFEISTGI